MQKLHLRVTAENTVRVFMFFGWSTYHGLMGTCPIFQFAQMKIRTDGIILDNDFN
jgi:hypothetical protein